MDDQKHREADLLARIEKIQHVLRHKARPEGYILLKKDVIIPQLERALEKVREGSHGECDDCPEAIPERRLKASPGAIRCLSCQTKFEKSRAVS